MTSRTPWLWTALALAAPALAEDVTILVGPRVEAGQGLAERKLFKAFDVAAEKLVACKTCTVTIKVAGGTQAGKGQVGQWIFPEVIAPGATLRILGGWDDAFARREPLRNPTILVTSERRSGPVLTFDGKKHALKELQVSGFAIDVAPGNHYDPRTNSLLKGSSSSWTILQFNYLTTERLVVSDNVFMNAANGVGAPLIRPAHERAEVVVRNNLFLNNVYCWQLQGATGKYPLKRYLVEGNSFILNFPYTPDPTTSNPGALEIGNKYTAELVEIRDNLFAFNVGGALFAQYDDKLGPKVSIQDNLFWENGALFGGKTPDKGAMVGKFNRSAVHGSYSPEDLEDFSWSVKGNVVVDPELAIPVLDMKAVSYGGKPQAKEEKPEGGGEVDFFGTPREAITLDAEVDGDDYAVDGKIKNYAPRMPFNVETLPFPKGDKAKAYGASEGRVQ